MIRKYTSFCNDFEINDLQIRTKEIKLNSHEIENEESYFDSKLFIPENGKFNKETLWLNSYQKMSKTDTDSLFKMKSCEGLNFIGSKISLISDIESDDHDHDQSLLLSDISSLSYTLNQSQSNIRTDEDSFHFLPTLFEEIPNKEIKMKINKKKGNEREKVEDYENTESQGVPFERRKKREKEQKRLKAQQEKEERKMNKPKKEKPKNQDNNTLEETSIKSSELKYMNLNTETVKAKETILETTDKSKDSNLKDLQVKNKCEINIPEENRKEQDVSTDTTNSKKHTKKNRCSYENRLEKATQQNFKLEKMNIEKKEKEKVNEEIKPEESEQSDDPETKSINFRSNTLNLTRAEMIKLQKINITPLIFKDHIIDNLFPTRSYSLYDDDNNIAGCIVFASHNYDHLSVESQPHAKQVWIPLIGCSRKYRKYNIYNELIDYVLEKCRNSGSFFCQIVNSENPEFLKKYDFEAIAKNPLFTTYLKKLKESDIVFFPKKLHVCSYVGEIIEKLSAKVITNKNKQTLKDIHYYSVWFDNSMLDQIDFDGGSIMGFYIYHMHALVGVVCGAIEIDLLNGCDLSLLIFICQVDEANNYYVDNGFETHYFIKETIYKYCEKNENIKNIIIHIPVENTGKTSYSLLARNTEKFTRVFEMTFFSSRRNRVYLPLYKQLEPKENFSKPPTAHKIILQPINKDNFTKTQLNELIESCYPIANKYNKNQLNITERIFKAAQCARQALIQLTDEDSFKFAGLIYFINFRDVSITRIFLFGCLPKYRRKGVGSALMQYALDCCSREVAIDSLIISTPLSAQLYFDFTKLKDPQGFLYFTRFDVPEPDDYISGEGKVETYFTDVNQKIEVKIVKSESESDNEDKHHQNKSSKKQQNKKKKKK